MFHNHSDDECASLSLEHEIIVWYNMCGLSFKLIREGRFVECKFQVKHEIEHENDFLLYDYTVKKIMWH